MPLFRRTKPEAAPADEPNVAQPVAEEPTGGEPAEPADLSDPNVAVRATELTKRFGPFTAVDAIDLEVQRGEIFGFLGPNGSGKTTTIRMLCGVIAPTAGQAEVLGCDVVAEPDKVRQRIGYMSQRFSLFEDLTVNENLRFYSGVYGLDAEQHAERRAYVLEMADLVGREDELTANLSVGWKQRLALGCATIHEPELIFLDEPTSGVDPTARRHFWELLYDLAARGVTLFVTTHYMDEATHCSRLSFIHDGEIIATGTPSAIRAELGGGSIYEIDTDDTEATLALLERAADIPEVYVSGAVLHANVGPSGSPGVITAYLDAAGLTPRSIVAVEPSIEDAFVHLVSTHRQPGTQDA